MKQATKFLSKGLLMGIADIIPGVSGGTIALITGIYERLINAIKGLNINFLKPLLKGNIRGSWNSLKTMDFPFLIPLGIGIAIAFGIGSIFIPYLLDNHTAITYAFFFGLILGSVKLVYKKIEKHNITGIIAGSIAFLAAFIIVGLDQIASNHAYWFIFIAGMIAICAMLLPGISGSFMLLVMGQYKFLLEKIKHLEFLYIISFSIGALIGLLGFSRVIAYLLKKFHSTTMWFLTGLMLGALRLPFDKVRETTSSTATGISLIALCFIIGLVAVIAIGKYDN